MQFSFTRYPLGIELENSENGYFRVKQIQPTSAARGTLRIGHEILQVDGKSTFEMSLIEFKQTIEENRDAGEPTRIMYRLPPEDVRGPLYQPFQVPASDRTSIDQTAVARPAGDVITTFQAQPELNTTFTHPIGTNDVMNPNDLKKTIINIDSRFRDYSPNESDTNFTYRLQPQFKNVIRIRLASIEFPNIFYTFARYLGNITFSLIYSGNKLPVTIDEGNYTVTDLQSTIQTKFNVYNTLYSIPGLGFRIAIDSFTGLVTISSTVTFGIDFTPPVDTNYNYSGIGWNLGFRQLIYSGSTSYTSEAIIDVFGEQYILFRLNDFNNVEQRLADKTIITAFAKIILRAGKFTMAYDDSSNFVTKEIVFPQPQNLSQLQVSFTDAYGTVIDNDGIHVSFALEVTEVMNCKLYDYYRNYLLHQTRI
jgi:PDZ domain